MKVGDIIKDLRKKKGLTQDELAKLLDVAPTTVSAWERHANMPLMDKVSFLSEIFNVPVSYFFQNDEMEEYINDIFSRPELRTLFSMSKKATKEQVEQTIKILEALRKE